MSSEIKLLPLPRTLKKRQGFLSLKGDVPAFLSPLAGPGELEALESFVAEARSRGQAALPIEKSWRPDISTPHIRFRIFGRDEKIDSDLTALPVSKELGTDGYVIDITTQTAIVAARSASGLFYAAQTLRQLMTRKRRQAVLPACRIIDWPDFKYRGVMLDVSRFKVPKLETLFRLADDLAALKINVIQLYVEHPFAWRRHPKIAKGASPLTAEEILLLERHCSRLHIELQANQQSFGHHRQMLQQKQYNDLAEVSSTMKFELPGDLVKRYPWLHKERMLNWSLSPAVPGSYKLLAEMLDEVLPLYNSELFNADCDETWDLGLGRSKKACQKKGIEMIYLEHIIKIHKLARARGKRLMIWGDIILDHPELIEQLPSEILLLDWAYKAQGDRNRTCRQFAKAGLEFWVCPGVNSWGSIFPRTEVARVNIHKFALAGKRHGASGLLNTDWGDDGHFQALSASWHGYAYGAEQSWRCSKVKDADFDRRFAWALYRDASGKFGRLFSVLGRTNSPFGSEGPLSYKSYPCIMLWESWICNKNEACMEDVKKPTQAQLGSCRKKACQALELVEELRHNFPQQASLLDECAFAARATLLALNRYSLRQQAREALSGGVALNKRDRAAVQALGSEWKKCRNTFEKLWLGNSRRSQISYRLKLFKKLDAEYEKLLKIK
jgi:hexosaminidase